MSASRPDAPDAPLPPVAERLNYLAAWWVVLAAVALLLSRRPLAATIAALAIMLVAVFVFGLKPPAEEDCASPRFLKQGHHALALGHLLFWPTALGMALLTGSASTMVFMVGGMLLLPGAALCYAAGLTMVEYTRWRGT